MKFLRMESEDKSAYMELDKLLSCVGNLILNHEIFMLSSRYFAVLGTVLFSQEPIFLPTALLLGFNSSISLRT